MEPRLYRGVLRFIFFMYVPCKHKYQLRGMDSASPINRYTHMKIPNIQPLFFIWSRYTEMTA